MNTIKDFRESEIKLEMDRAEIEDYLSSKLRRYIISYLDEVEKDLIGNPSQIDIDFVIATHLGGREESILNEVKVYI